MTRPSTRTKRQLKERRVLAAYAAGLDPTTIAYRELVPVGQVIRLLCKQGIELEENPKENHG